MENNLQKYYEYTHRANVAMCRLNNDLAFKLFDSAFTFMSYPFEVDLNNAVYTGIHSSKPDEDQIVHYMKMMASKGIDLYEKYKDLPGHLSFVSKLQRDEVSTSPLLDSSYVKNVKDAIASDQVLRNFSVSLFKRPYENSLLPAIDKIDSMNYQVMDSIFRHALEVNISLEQLLGTEANSDLEIIYIHNVSWGRYNKDLTDSLVAQGIVDARQFAYFYDKNCSSFYGQFPKEGTRWGNEFKCNDFYGIYGTHLVYQYADGTAFIPLLEPWEIAIVNNNRKELFLGDVYEEAKLKVFSHRNNAQGVESPLKAIFPANAQQMAEFEYNLLGWRPGYVKYSPTDSFEFDKAPIIK